MKRAIFSVIAGAALLASTGGAVFADPPGSGPNPGNPQSTNSDNCIASASSALTGNGNDAGGTLGEGNNSPGQTGPSHGVRGAEIKGLQALCGGQAK